MRLEAKSLVITGAGNGIGREVALQALRRGAQVAAVDLSLEALQETERLAGAGSRLSLHEVDLRDADGVSALPSAVLEAHGQIDGLMNVAGIIQPFVPVIDLDLPVIERVMDVNFFGLVRLVKAFLPILTQRPEACLAAVSSMGSYLPVPGQTVYGASKAAVAQLMDGLAAELVDSSVTVTTIFPGATSTEIADNSGVTVDVEDGPKVPMLTPAKAATLILDGVQRGTFHVYTGVDSKAARALTKIAPKRTGRLLAKQMSELLQQASDEPQTPSDTNHS